MFQKSWSWTSVGLAPNALGEWITIMSHVSKTEPFFFQENPHVTRSPFYGNQGFLRRRVFRDSSDTRSHPTCFALTRKPCCTGSSSTSLWRIVGRWVLRNISKAYNGSGRQYSIPWNTFAGTSWPGFQSATRFEIIYWQNTNTTSLSPHTKFSFSGSLYLTDTFFEHLWGSFF